MYLWIVVDIGPSNLHLSSSDNSCFEIPLSWVYSYITLGIAQLVVISWVVGKFQVLVSKSKILVSLNPRIQSSSSWSLSNSFVVLLFLLSVVIMVVIFFNNDMSRVLVCVKKNQINYTFNLVLVASLVKLAETLSSTWDGVSITVFDLSLVSLAVNVSCNNEIDSYVRLA